MNQHSLQPAFKETWTPACAGVTILKPEIRALKPERAMLFWVLTSGFCLLDRGPGSVPVTSLTSPTPKYGEVREVKHKNRHQICVSKLHPGEVKDEVRVKLR